jgi:hypothetical protein
MYVVMTGLSCHNYHAPDRICEWLGQDLFVFREMHD